MASSGNNELTLSDVIKQCMGSHKKSVELLAHADISFVENDEINCSQLCVHATGFSDIYLNLRDECSKILSFVINKTASTLSRKEALKILDDTDIRSMLSFYGEWKILLILAEKSKDFTYEYTDSIASSGHISKLLDIDKYDIYNMNSQIVLPLVANIGTLDINKTFLFNHIIFKKFIYYYLCVSILSTIHCKPINILKCPIYRSHGFCVKCLNQDIMKESFLGYTMIFCANNICKVLQEISDKKLKQIINECYKKNAIGTGKNLTNISMKIQLLKKWNINDFHENGKNYIFSAFNYYVTMNNKNKNCDIFQYEDAPKLFYMTGDAHYFPLKQYKNATICYVLSIVSRCNLYERVLSLIALSTNCYSNKQYLIGFKVLKCAYKLCKGCILPSFVNKEYKIKRKQFKSKCHKMKCFGCNRMGQKLKACKGCMKAVYCRKYCQKKHWKKHKMKCDGIWRSTIECQRISGISVGCYQLLKHGIFAPLQTH